MARSFSDETHGESKSNQPEPVAWDHSTRRPNLALINAKYYARKRMAQLNSNSAHRKLEHQVRPAQHQDEANRTALEPPLLKLSIPSSVVSTRRRRKTTVQLKSSKKKTPTRKKRTRNKKVDRQRSSGDRGPAAVFPKLLGQHQTNDYRLFDKPGPRPRRSRRVREFNSRLAQETYMARAGTTMGDTDDETFDDVQPSQPVKPVQQPIPVAPQPNNQPRPGQQMAIGRGKQDMSRAELLALVESLEENLNDSRGQVASLRQTNDQLFKETRRWRGDPQNARVGDKRPLDDPDFPTAKRARRENSPTPELDYDKMSLAQIVEVVRRHPQLKAGLPLTHMIYVDRELDKEFKEYTDNRQNPPPPPAGATLADAEEDIVHMRTVRDVDVSRQRTQARLSALARRQPTVDRPNPNAMRPGVCL